MAGQNDDRVSPKKLSQGARPLRGDRRISPKKARNISHFDDAPDRIRRKVSTRLLLRSGKGPRAMIAWPPGGMELAARIQIGKALPGRPKTTEWPRRPICACQVEPPADECEDIHP